MLIAQFESLPCGAEYACVSCASSNGSYRPYFIGCALGTLTFSFLKFNPTLLAVHGPPRGWLCVGQNFKTIGRVFVNSSFFPPLR